MEKESKLKKPWYKRVWVWIGIVVLLMIISSALAPKEEPTKVVEGADLSTSSPPQTIFKPGDAIAFDGKKVTVAAAERNWNSGNQFITAQSGNEYVKVQVTIENSSADQVSYNTFDWKMQDSKGVIKDVASASYGVDGALSSGELAPKGKVAGFLVFEVPAGDPGLTLQYAPSFWSSKKVEVKL